MILLYKFVSVRFYTMVKKLFKHIIIVILSLILFLASVTAIVQFVYYREKTNTSVSELDFISAGDSVFLTAHRGVTSAAPENTIPAFVKADEMNYYAAECDIMLTKDNVWVLSHDDTTFLHFWGSKSIANTNYAELAKMTYKNGVNFWKFGNLRIPTLDEYLDVFIDSNTRPQIEIKSKSTENLEMILTALEERKLKDKAMIISFNIEQLLEIRKLDSEIEVWYLCEEITDDVLDNLKKLGTNVKLGIKASANSDEVIKNTINQEINLAAWTINSEKDLKRVYELGIRYITTDTFCN